MQAIQSTFTTAYNRINFYKGLLILNVKRANIRHTKPLYTELQPFVEAGFNVWAWKRYLAQDTLRFGDRVTVYGGPHHGRLGVINTCWPGNAVIAAIGEDDDREGVTPTLLEVDMRSLDRCFRVGDNIQTIPKYEGEPMRYSQVINVTETTLQDLVQRKKRLRHVMKSVLYEDEEKKTALAEEICRLKKVIWTIKCK